MEIIYRVHIFNICMKDCLNGYGWNVRKLTTEYIYENCSLIGILSVQSNS